MNTVENGIYNQAARSTILGDNWAIGQVNENFDFGAVDKKGRKIGACIMTFEREYSAVVGDDAPRGFYCVTPGRYFAFTPHATRDGGFYGAGQSSHLFHTAAERDAAVAKYLKAAKARAVKIAGK